MYLILLLADAQKCFEIYKNKLLYIYADICCTKGWKVDDRSSVNSDGACWTLVVFRVSNKFIKLYIPPLFFYIPPPVYPSTTARTIYTQSSPFCIILAGKLFWFFDFHLLSADRSPSSFTLWFLFSGHPATTPPPSKYLKTIWVSTTIRNDFTNVFFTFFLV